MKQEQYNISGMSCAACSSSVQRVVSKLNGVESCEVNLITGKMTVNYDETKTGDLGFTPSVQTVKNKSGFVGMFAIAKLWLPLTRELSSEARLRERKGCVFMRSYFSPSVFLLTQKSTSQLPFRSVLLSLRLEIATGNPHPRQREARAVIKFSPLQTLIYYLRFRLMYNI